MSESFRAIVTVRGVLRERRARKSSVSRNGRFMGCLGLFVEYHFQVQTYITLAIHVGI